VKVAVCDDESVILRDTIFLVENIIEKNGYEVFCEGFNDANSLLKSVEKEKQSFDIYILDIEINGVNGVEIAKKIRELQKYSIIIFLTNYDNWMKDAFEVQAFNYILKYEKNKKLEKVIEKSLKYMKDSEKVYYFKQGKSLTSISYNDIYYFESQKRKMKICTNNEEYFYYDIFKEVESRVDSNIFTRVHISFLVNMNHILSFNGKSIILDNKDLVPVSRSYLATFNETYMKYLKDRS